MENEKLNVTISFEVRTVDGDPFFDAQMNYYRMGRDKLNVVEREIVNMLAALNAAGRATAEVPLSQNGITYAAGKEN
jgi:hypothetical protein